MNLITQWGQSKERWEMSQGGYPHLLSWVTTTLLFKVHPSFPPLSFPWGINNLKRLAKVRWGVLHLGNRPSFSYFKERRKRKDGRIFFCFLKKTYYMIRLICHPSLHFFAFCPFSGVSKNSRPETDPITCHYTHSDSLSFTCTHTLIQLRTECRRYCGYRSKLAGWSLCRQIR